jgi:NADH-quinone oxidoreductase subunit M
MINPFGSQLLNVITYLPLVGGLMVLVLFRREHKWAVARFATWVAALDLLVSLVLWIDWWKAPEGPYGFRFVQQLPWIDAIGVRYLVGVDGISMLMVLLTTVLGFVAILSSWTSIQHRVKEYYAFLLFLQTGMIGVFVSLDLFLFYIFWEVMLVPMYFIIGVWGGERRIYAAVKFFIYTFLGSVLMLLGILALYLYHGSVTDLYTFDVRQLHMMGMWSDWFDLQYWVWLAFFLGFAIKVPMFPFHTWLPDAHTEAPTAGSVILAGVLLKMGSYGFLRFSLPIMPEATKYFLPWALGLCVVGVIYGAMVALMQKDWKKLVAYSSVSHLGFAMIGIFALNAQGLTGGVLQMVNHGLSTGALFLIVGIIYERRHTRMIADYGGLWSVMPVFGVFFMVMMLSSIGMPAIPGNGFVGEFTVLLGAFLLPQKYWAVLAATGIVLGAVYMLWLYQRTMFGKLDKDENRKLVDLNFREVMTLLPLVVLSFWIGLYPKPVCCGPAPRSPAAVSGPGRAGDGRRRAGIRDLRRCVHAALVSREKCGLEDASRPALGCDAECGLQVVQEQERPEEHGDPQHRAACRPGAREDPLWPVVSVNALQKPREPAHEPIDHPRPGRAEPVHDPAVRPRQDPSVDPVAVQVDRRRFLRVEPGEDEHAEGERSPQQQLQRCDDMRRRVRLEVHGVGEQPIQWRRKDADQQTQRRRQPHRHEHVRGGLLAADPRVVGEEGEEGDLDAGVLHHAGRRE